MYFIILSLNCNVCTILFLNEWELIPGQKYFFKLLTKSTLTPADTLFLEMCISNGLKNIWILLYFIGGWLLCSCHHYNINLLELLFSSLEILNICTHSAKFSFSCQSQNVVLKGKFKKRQVCWKIETLVPGATHLLCTFHHLFTDYCVFNQACNS